MRQKNFLEKMPHPFRILIITLAVLYFGGGILIGIIMLLK